MVGSSLREGNLFAPEGFGADTTADGLFAARSIVANYQSGLEVEPTSMPKLMDTLYPIAEYDDVAKNLTKYFAPFTQNAVFTPTNATNLQMIFGDVLLGCSAAFTAAAVAAQRNQDRPAYLYLFNHTSSNELLGRLGPTHASEIPYVFGTFEEYAVFTSSGRTTWTPTAFEQELSNTIMGYWLNFGRHLDPNGAADGSNLATWPAAGCAGNNNFMVFGDDGAGEGARLSVVWTTLS